MVARFPARLAARTRRPRYLMWPRSSGRPRKAARRAAACRGPDRGRWSMPGRAGSHPRRKGAAAFLPHCRLPRRSGHHQRRDAPPPTARRLHPRPSRKRWASERALTRRLPCRSGARGARAVSPSSFPASPTPRPGHRTRVLRPRRRIRRPRPSRDATDHPGAV